MNTITKTWNSNFIWTFSLNLKYLKSHYVRCYIISWQIKVSSYNIILCVYIYILSVAVYTREMCNLRKLFWYLKTQPENQIKDFTVAWRTTMHRRNESGISRSRRETDITAQISRGRSCICTCKSAQNTRYVAMKFEGGYSMRPTKNTVQRKKKTFH